MINLARISERTFRDFNPGDRMTEKEYERDREIVRLAINDLEDRFQVVDDVGLEVNNTKELLNATISTIGDANEKADEALNNASRVLQTNEALKVGSNGVQYDDPQARLNAEIAELNSRINNAAPNYDEGNWDVTKTGIIIDGGLW